MEVIHVGYCQSNGHHYHIPDPEQIELRNLRKKVKDRAQSETNSIPKIYEEELARSNLSSTALTLAPVAVEIKSGLNRMRRKTTPPLPTSADFDIPDFYQQTLNGTQFICTDKIIKKKRMILFATDKQLEVLFSSEWIFLDGTFDKCPKQFQQIYTIHGLKFQQNFPCVICLLSGKTADIYRQLFLELNDHATRLKMKFEPKHVMSDFEMSLIKVIKGKLPNAIHHGCFFHFTQSLYKHINSLGLSTAYLENEDLRLACRSAMALALLPQDHIEEAFELLKNESPEELIDFFKYFHNQWLKRIPKKYWNVSNLEFRTNNICETWHNKFNNRVEKHHPNVWHLFKCLQREELSFRQQLSKVNSGFQIGSSIRTCSIRAQIDVLNERHEQKQINLIDFLYGLSTLVAKNSK
ncbi:unnamed protein product [Rotaria sordida]|uniref:MULE transposase domain-containing protein n=1 Tax=Rotaria sordida TaxID=392033 RepID=A0A814TS18_9BILA|nr:unnamed protein product [Rotaria sordida]